MKQNAKNAKNKTGEFVQKYDHVSFSGIFINTPINIEVHISFQSFWHDKFAL